MADGERGEAGGGWCMAAGEGGEAVVDGGW